MTELNALAERAEAATEPDRDMDALIHAAVNGATAEWQKDREAYAYHRDGRWISLGLVPTYTASVEAALYLVPDGWFTFFAAEDRHSHSWRWELRGGYGLRAAARAATPALAIIAAALRAQGEG